MRTVGVPVKPHAQGMRVKITYDPAKREKTRAERELDFEDAPQVFAGVTLTLADDRQDYGEPRYQTVGLLNERLVMIVWTERPALATSSR